MALNPGKCNFMCLGSNLLLDEIFTLKSASINEILGVTVDRELKIDKHVKHVPKKAGNKLNILKHSFQTFYQRSVQLLPTFMDVLFTLVKQFD